MHNKRYNERVKLAVAWVDRLSTLILAGGILAPVFQHQAMAAKPTAAWLFGAVMLHLVAQYGLGITKEEP